MGSVGGESSTESADDDSAYAKGAVVAEVFDE